MVGRVPEQSTAAPARRGHLRRARLHAALAAPGRRPVTTIYAPAGTGKTGLVLDWIDMVGAARGTGIVDLDAGGGAGWWRAPARAPAWWPGSAVSVDELVRELPGALPDGAAGAATIVLDGTDAVTGTGFLAGAGRLAAVRRLHVVLVGRVAPPGDPRWCLDGNRLRWADLAFTAAETAALCAARGLEVPAAVHRRLYAITGGWPSGLMVGTAALAETPHEPDDVLERLLRTGGELAEYFLRDVLGTEPAELRQAVQDSCVAESVCPDLFAALTGRADAGSILAGLAQERRFATRLDAGSLWYRYHRLWRSALYTALVEDDPGRARRLHRAAGGWYARHHQPAEALRHALAGADRSTAVRMAYLHGDEIRATPARSFITAAAPHPWTSLAEDPALAHAFAVFHGVTGGALESSLSRHRPATGAADLAVQGAHPSPAAILHGAAEAAEAGETIHPAAVPAWRALRRGDIAVAAAAQPLPRTTELRLRAVTARLAGRLGDAVLHAEELGRITRDGGLLGCHDDGWARLVLAEVAVQRGAPVDAVRHLDVLAIEVWQSVPALVAAQRLQTALILQQRQEHAAALELVDGLIADGDDALLIPRSAARVLRVELLIAIGRQPDAARHWRLDAATTGGPAAALTSAKLTLALQPRARVDGLLQPMLDAPRISLLHRIEVRLLLAHQAHTAGAGRQAAQLLRQAEVLAGPEGIRHPFHAVRPLLAETLDRSARVTAGLLSLGEATVLRQLAGSGSIGEIAADLHLSRNTVKTHVASIYRKLAVHSRRAAVEAARSLDRPPAHK